jgi:deazaflavin-dependent oxidoreductase (nitroreductase family)
VPLEGEYEPSPWEPIAEQVELFERTDGAEGNEFMGGPCIILTTKGAKSSKLRKTPLIRVTDGTSYAVVGSMGGAPTNPQWVHNLRAHPWAELQDGATRRDYTVREAEGDDKAAWWKIATEVWPDYDTYQESTDRVIPLFVLEPAD